MPLKVLTAAEETPFYRQIIDGTLGFTITEGDVALAIDSLDQTFLELSSAQLASAMKKLNTIGEQNDLVWLANSMSSISIAMMYGFLVGLQRRD